MKSILVSFPTELPLANSLIAAGDYAHGNWSCHTFPDGESKIKLHFDPSNRDIIIVADLKDPNPKIMPLILLIDTLKDLGAKSCGLVCPYMPYLRQDKRFYPGEGISAQYFGRLFNHYAHWLITVDPHLHRLQELDDILNIPGQVVSSASLIGQWIEANVSDPLLIGPDSESRQWVEQIAQTCDFPFIVLNKKRHGDREVEIDASKIQSVHEKTPILVDDIISTGQTLIQANLAIKASFTKPSICIGVHGLFIGDAFDALAKTSKLIVTTNSIVHPSNGIDIATVIIPAINGMLTNQKGTA